MRATVKLSIPSVSSESTHDKIVESAWNKIAKYLGLDTIEEAKARADASLEIIENEHGGLAVDIYVRVR